MNKYASLALAHWETYRPNELAAMSDREKFFAEIGEQISYQISELSRQLAGSGPAGEAYLTKVARLGKAKLAAEAQVLQETLPAAED
jgi:hypothetical protein